MATARSVSMVAGSLVRVLSPKINLVFPEKTTAMSVPEQVLLVQSAAKTWPEVGFIPPDTWAGFV